MARGGWRAPTLLTADPLDRALLAQPGAASRAAGVALGVLRSVRDQLPAAGDHDGATVLLADLRSKAADAEEDGLVSLQDAGRIEDAIDAVVVHLEAARRDRSTASTTTTAPTDPTASTAPATTVLVDAPAGRQEQGPDAGRAKPDKGPKGDKRGDGDGDGDADDGDD